MSSGRNAEILSGWQADRAERERKEDLQRLAEENAALRRKLARK